MLGTRYSYNWDYSANLGLIWVLKNDKYIVEHVDKKLRIHYSISNYAKWTHKYGKWTKFMKWLNCFFQFACRMKSMTFLSNRESCTIWIVVRCYAHSSNNLKWMGERDWMQMRCIHRLSQLRGPQKQVYFTYVAWIEGFVVFPHEKWIKKLYHHV